MGRLMTRDKIAALVEECHVEREAVVAVQEKYGWKEGEREAMAAEMAERERRNKSEDTLA